VVHLDENSFSGCLVMNWWIWRYGETLYTEHSEVLGLTLSLLKRFPSVCFLRKVIWFTSASFLNIGYLAPSSP
jgi:hypothetical protein